MLFGERRESRAVVSPLARMTSQMNSSPMLIPFSFKQGRTKEHLELMMNLTSAALEVSKVQEVKTTSISFNAHGVFDPTSSYPEHMVRYTSLRKDVTSGGIVLVMGVPELGGDFRYASEKSLVYQDGLFFVANAVLQQDFSPKVFEILAAKFEAAAALEEIEFPKT